ncbi:MAG TPA: bile acid:sodium symporter [Williamsia sp.]
MVAGAVVGWSVSGSGSVLAALINPALGALLYVTFLQVPAADLGRAFRDHRFIAALILLNFVVVPVVVGGLFTFLPSEQAVRVGVLLVLLCPCVDYVIVFAGLAGGSRQRLIAATPILLLLQMALLPFYLWLFMGPDLTDVVDNRPFVEAFLYLIAVPLALAWATQWAANRATVIRRFEDGATAVMVPLMAVVLFAVVGSQLPELDGLDRDVVAVVPVYVIFLVVMAGAGMLVSALFSLDAAGRRSVVFSGATRNSLVVMPLALALPAGYEVAAVVVVTQTLVEIIGMTVYVKVIPRLVPARTV